MQLIGPIVRLQVQPRSLKVAGPRGERYDPTPLRAVSSLLLGPAGALGALAGERLLDVHHRDHPETKHRPDRNAVSVGFTSHYAAMRQRLGDHLADGLAGENILVQSDRLVEPVELAGGLVIQTRRGAALRLAAVRVAEPCIPFTRFGLQAPADAPVDESVQATLRFLRGGMRGFYASVDRTAETATEVRLGDLVYRL